MHSRDSSKRSAVETLGRVGLPAPIRELAAQRWDAIIVGGGHNGLTCAAYLSRAGKRVLVLEARERIGGACTIEEPWPGVRMSPCAYLAGLLHPIVIEELNLPARGYCWIPAMNGLFIPFEDGSSVQLYDDDEPCYAEIARISPPDIEGWRAMSNLFGRVRGALRPPNEDDVWIGEPPTREQIEDRLGNDPEARALLFEWSMADLVEHFLRDERLQSSAPTPVLSMQAPPPFASITPLAASVDCPARGVTSRAAWAWSRSFSPMPRRKRAQQLQPA
jgi:phytoene dehydrogenase-like protein